jgi:hypothetical protein
MLEVSPVTLPFSSTSCRPSQDPNNHAPQQVLINIRRPSLDHTGVDEDVMDVSQ